LDDKASKLEKGIVIVQYIPVVKAYKVVKKTEKDRVIGNLVK